MMTADAPAWGQWTTFYDPAGQVPSMARSDSEDGLVVSFTFDRMQLDVQGYQDAPFAGAMGLSGALSVSMPDDYHLAGFLLIVRGSLTKSLGSGAALSCSIGHATKTIEWPLDSVSGIKTAGPSNTGQEEPFPEGSFLDTSFNSVCFMADTPPGRVGQPPFPQLPPLPITMSMQARRRFVDEAVTITITGFEALILSG
jgi:hypothetical protein